MSTLTIYRYKKCELGPRMLGEWAGSIIRDVMGRFGLVQVQDETDWMCTLVAALFPTSTSSCWRRLEIDIP